MKFDVIRTSDFEAGRVGADATQPIPEAVFNKEENTWEVDIATLEDMMALAGRVGSAVLLLPVDETGEVPVLEIRDVT
jgi:hypothetical protein